jgi:putative PIN family toxin of toxin-antitoxin system
MTPPLTLIDTNVLLSAVVTPHRLAAPARILAAALENRVRLIVSPAILGEYRGVLLRGDVARRHRLAATDIDTLLVRVIEDAIVVEPPLSHLAAPDTGDQAFWDVLASRPEVTFVTGDRVLQRSEDFPGHVLSPAEFVARYGL